MNPSGKAPHEENGVNPAKVERQESLAGTECQTNQFRKILSDQINQYPVV